MLKVLYKRDSKGKVRLSSLELVERVNNTYLIERKSGLSGGKLKKEQDIIEEGRAGRTAKEQAELKFTSLLNKLKDKGYKTPEEYCKSSGKEEFTFDLIPKQSTSAEGELRPMLASPMKSNFILDKPWIAQFKLNGVRCTMFKKDGQIVARSRAGKSYDIPTSHIRRDLEGFFSCYPDGFLDGELYIHGTPLQEISGMARRQEEAKSLQYHVYDGLEILDNNIPNIERLSLDLEDTDRVMKVTNFEVDSFESLHELEDKALGLGYEGLILREHKATYQFGKRSNSLIKVKQFIDEEFEIIGKTYGKRGVEDLMFICVQEEHKEFTVKMTGSKDYKEKLDREIIVTNTSTIDKKLTVKYFERTKDNIPSHAVGLEIRDYE